MYHFEEEEEEEETCKAKRGIGHSFWRELGEGVHPRNGGRDIDNSREEWEFFDEKYKEDDNECCVYIHIL